MPNTFPDFRSHHLIPLDLPVHPKLAKFFGYEGERDLVGFCWYPGGLTFDDGQTAGSAARWYPWTLYLQHPKVRAQLWAYILGADDEEPVHMLLLDRRAGTLWVGHREDVARVLRPEPEESGPVEPLEVTEEDLRQFMDSLVLKEVSPADIQERRRIDMKVQNEFQAWLDSL